MVWFEHDALVKFNLDQSIIKPNSFTSPQKPLSMNQNHIKFTLFPDRGQLESSVGEEKRYNPRLTKDIDSFVDIMEHLNLPKPKMIGKLII